MYNLELLEKSSAKATIELKGEEFKKGKRINRK